MNPTDLEERIAWCEYASKYHGWYDLALPPMADGKFESSCHEAEYQNFLAGVEWQKTREKQ